jgi:nitronate monooxygenase
MTLRQALGIDLPIIRAPMAGAQGSAMAIAVSNAGGLGSLPCAMLSHYERTWHDPDQVTCLKPI